MVLESSRLWDTAGDCAQILLCLVILVFFIKNRLNQKRSASGRTANVKTASFSEHVHAQGIQQHIEQSFANMTANLAAERENLMSVLGLNRESLEKDSIFRMQTFKQMAAKPLARQSSVEGASDETPRDKIRKYSARGLSARKISDELKVPLSEVELILSLQAK